MPYWSWLLGDLILTPSSLSLVKMGSASPRISKIIPDIRNSGEYNLLIYADCPLLLHRWTKVFHSLRKYTTTRSLTGCFNYVCKLPQAVGHKETVTDRFFFRTGFWAKMKRIWDFIHVIHLSIFLQHHSDIPLFIFCCNCTNPCGAQSSLQFINSGVFLGSDLKFPNREQCFWMMWHHLFSFSC